MVIETLWSLVQIHPYLALFPLILLEGPLATVFAGTLVAVGTMAFPLTAALAVTAEVIADAAFFTLGRLSRHARIRRHLPRLGLTEARRAPIESDLARNLPALLAGAKVLDAAAVPVILAAGASGVGYTRFLAWGLALSIPKSLLLLGLGALFGTQLTRLLSPTTGILLTLAALAAYLLATTLRRSSSQGARS